MALEAEYVSTVFVCYSPRLKIHTVSATFVYFGDILGTKYMIAVFVYDSTEVDIRKCNLTAYLAILCTEACIASHLL